MRDQHPGHAHLRLIVRNLPGPAAPGFGLAARVPGSVSPGRADGGKPLAAPTGVTCERSELAQPDSHHSPAHLHFPTSLRLIGSPSKNFRSNSCSATSISQNSPQNCLKYKIIQPIRPQEPHREPLSPINPPKSLLKAPHPPQPAAPCLCQLTRVRETIEPWQSSSHRGTGFPSRSVPGRRRPSRPPRRLPPPPPRPRPRAVPPPATPHPRSTPPPRPPAARSSASASTSSCPSGDACPPASAPHTRPPSPPSSKSGTSPASSSPSPTPPSAPVATSTSASGPSATPSTS